MCIVPLGCNFSGAVINQATQANSAWSSLCGWTQLVFRHICSAFTTLYLEYIFTLSVARGSRPDAGPLHLCIVAHCRSVFVCRSTDMYYVVFLDVSASTGRTFCFMLDPSVRAWLIVVVNLTVVFM